MYSGKGQLAYPHGTEYINADIESNSTEKEVSTGVVADRGKARMLYILFVAGRCVSRTRTNLALK